MIQVEDCCVRFAAWLVEIVDEDVRRLVSMAQSHQRACDAEAAVIENDVKVATRGRDGTHVRERLRRLLRERTSHPVGGEAPLATLAHAGKVHRDQLLPLGLLDHAAACPQMRKPRVAIVDRVHLHGTDRFIRCADARPSAGATSEGPPRGTLGAATTPPLKVAFRCGRERVPRPFRSLRWGHSHGQVEGEWRVLRIWKQAVDDVSDFRVGCLINHDHGRRAAINSRCHQRCGRVRGEEAVGGVRREQQAVCHRDDPPNCIAHASSDL
eukprot:646628-Prymnesium_polylepis.1